MLAISSTPAKRCSSEVGRNCFTNCDAASSTDWPLCLARSLTKVSTDRKSTRLNSSHGYISYAVFCLKKKKKNEKLTLHGKAKSAGEVKVKVIQTEHQKTSNGYIRSRM